MHEQLGGHGVAAAVVEQPRAEGLGQLLGAGVAQLVEGCEDAGTEVGVRARVGGQHQLGEVLLAVGAEPEASDAQGPLPGLAHLRPRSSRTGHRALAVERPQQRPPGATVDVGDQEQGHPLGLLGRLQRLGRHRAQHAAHLGLGDHDRREGARRRPVRAGDRRLDRLRRRAVDEVLREALQQPLADATRGLELVVVPGQARCRELLDVGEDQLGEQHQAAGVDARAHGCGRELAPGDPRADAVRREQGVDGAAAPGLAATQLVGAVDCERGGLLGPFALRAGGQLDEPAERRLHGDPDGLAHGSAERVGVARDVVDDGRDGALGDVGQDALQLRDGVFSEQERGGRHLRSHFSSSANKRAGPIHALRS